MPEYQLIVGVLFEGRREIAEAAHMDAPLDLETAVWVPELCIPDPVLGRVPVFTVAALRGAIERGELRPERHGRLLYVSRRIVMEWRERCRAAPPDPASTRSPPSLTMTGRSGSGRFGSSATASLTSQPAARSSLNFLTEAAARLSRRSPTT
ncbi:DNA-binding protein [Methylobacterium sp. WL69]|uniref:DNA-binding protein n=1 Tax=Methylobacterium sp. WL69 TaxID=2603893 RepID=UPI001FEDA5AB|nr:DNA-binding protein [Methylobacterium sp. WL69]